MFSANSSEADEHDSIFSENSDEIDPRYVTRIHQYDLIDVKGFTKFKEFVNETMGGILAALWIDIDHSRFALKGAKHSSFLTKLREKYLSVGSVNRLSKELLKKWKIEHASQWTIKHLQAIQEDIAEPLLLYWAPRFLIRQTSIAQKSNTVKTARDREEFLLNRRFSHRAFRPLSSQSHPSPKTVIIRPLRPKSCLPRIKPIQVGENLRPSTTILPHPPKETQYHTMSPRQELTYHPKYIHPMYHAMTFKTDRDRVRMPKSLFPQPKPVRSRPNSKYWKDIRTKSNRPSSAGQLTMGTLAIFESKARVKSAREISSSYPQVHTEKFSSIHTSDAQSMTSVHSASSTSTKATIRGSEPMESMLQALYYDTRAGWFFTRYCEQSNNKSWSNAVHFWFDVQDYRNQYYMNIINSYAIQRKAQVIYSTYVVMGAAEDIGVATSVRIQISKKLEPAFEELFDMAEEYILKLLIVPWNKMMGDDQASYKKIELIEQERNLNVASKYLNVLQKKGILKERPRTAEMDLQAQDRYEEDLWSKVPEEYQNFTFDDLIRNRMELEHFRKFLEDNYAKTDLLCWLDIESFKRVPHHAQDKRDEKAKDIKTKYLHKKYFFGPSSPASKEQQTKVVQAAGGWGATIKERPPNELIIEAQKYVKNRLGNRWLPRFLATSAFLDRQAPKSQMSDVAEDVILQKKKKKGEPWKLLDNRWQTSSREVVEFRHALSNPVTSSQFRRYVSVKGDLLENDLLFWLEVQKYKDFCHAHNEQAAIDAKISAIIHCFLDSQIPPSLQIDIPTEMAERIIEKRRELGPYVFREAQLTVFRVLFPLWTGFCEFRKNLTDEKLTTTLERQRARKLERVKRQLIEQHNEQIAKEEAQAAKEREEEAAALIGNQDPLAEILSSAGSDGGDSGTARSRKSQVSWSYGKYIEGLDRERHLLLMENELKGRIPLEPLPEVDPDVSSRDSDSVLSDNGSGSFGGSRSNSDASGSVTSKSGDKTRRRRKKTKDKIIHTTIREPPKNGTGEKSTEDVREKVNERLKNGKKGSSKQNGSNDPVKANGKEENKERKVVVID